MDDLHKPLGQKQPEKTQRNWVAIGTTCLVVGLSSAAAYIFVDARSTGKTVVALNSEPVSEQQAPAKPSPTLKTNDEPTEDEPFDINKVKPLTPLEPLPETGENRPVEPKADPPSFTPKPAPAQRISEWLPNPNLIEQSEFGPLPRISDGGVRPLDAYSRSSGVTGANRVAIIMGGLGLSQTGSQSAIKELPSSITLGFSPFGNSLQRWMQEARRGGHEVVLQLPMEPLGYPTVNPGPRTLTSTANSGENLQNLRWSLGRMTNYPLVINYLGAGLTSKPEILRPLMAELKQRGLGYIDDGTASASAAIGVAGSLRLPNAQGNIVIDTDRTPQRIRANLQSLEAFAKARGFAIATATAFPETVTVLKEWAEDAAKRGIIIVPASTLLKDYGR